MKINWISKQDYFLAEVEYRLSNDLIAVLDNFTNQFSNHFQVDSKNNILITLARHFNLASDVREAHISEGKLKSVALCPASAWHFNYSIINLLKLFKNKKDGSVYFTDIDLKKFGFNVQLPETKENKFLQPARTAGYDIIRTSSIFPLYVIRNLEGKMITLYNQFTNETSHIAIINSTDKFLTYEILSLAGLPTPKTFIIDSADEANKILEIENYKSVVIKPRKMDRGLGVYTNLKNSNDIITSFSEAQKYGSVILQEHIEGDDYRLLVVDGKVIGVTQRKPFRVVGSGHQTILELIKEKLLFRSKHPFYKNYNNINAFAPDISIMLARQNFNLHSVPSKGEVVLLRSNANVSTGGEHEDVTSKCHIDVKNLAIYSAKLVGLDIAGIDYITPDITKSWTESNGYICEINPTPALSVDGAQSQLFSRFKSSGTTLPKSDYLGDVMYIKNCMCEKLLNIQSNWPNHNLVDITKVSEKQYFHQSFLCMKDGCFIFLATAELLRNFGFVNTNVRTIAYCKECTNTALTELTSWLNTPFNVDIVFI
jgi:D-alanine-D-alanine ligase-like ATP-grasp enzyme